MHDKNAEIRKVCDNTLDIIAVSWSSSVFSLPSDSVLCFLISLELASFFRFETGFCFPLPVPQQGVKYSNTEQRSAAVVSPWENSFGRSEH